MKLKSSRQFPGSPVVRTPHFHYYGLVPSWGTKILQAMWHGQTKKKRKLNLSIENSAARDCCYLCWMTLTPLEECMLCSGDMIRSSNILNTVCEAPGSELVLLSLGTGRDEVTHWTHLQVSVAIPRSNQGMTEWPPASTFVSFIVRLEIASLYGPSFQHCRRN